MMIPKVIFCHKCHRPTKVPEWVDKVNVEQGFITIECGNVTDHGGKKTKCGGKIKFKTKRDVVEER